MTRFSYLGDHRLGIMNDILFDFGAQPVLFAPTDVVRVATFTALYGGSPLRMNTLLFGRQA